MSDYSNGKIYKIYSKTLDNCYFGSTIQTLKERLSKHKYEFKKQKGKCSEIVLKYNDYEMILVELYPCNSKKELLEREGYYHRNFKCVNKLIAGRTKKQYREDHKKEINIKNKQYHEKHKEKISEKRKVKMTCSCGSVVRKNAIRRHERSKKHLKYIESQKLNEVSNRV